MDAKIQQLMHQLKNSKVKIEADFEASLADALQKAELNH